MSLYPKNSMADYNLNGIYSIGQAEPATVHPVAPKGKDLEYFLILGTLGLAGYLAYSKMKKPKYKRRKRRNPSKKRRNSIWKHRPVKLESPLDRDRRDGRRIRSLEMELMGSKENNEDPEIIRSLKKRIKQLKERSPWH